MTHSTTSSNSNRTTASNNNNTRKNSDLHIVEKLNSELEKCEALKPCSELKVFTVTTVPSAVKVTGGTDALMALSGTDAEDTLNGTDVEMVLSGTGTDSEPRPKHLETCGPIPYSPPPTPQGYTVAQLY